MSMCVTVLLLMTSWTLFDRHAASQETCEPGWFGSSCQYKCRCRNDRCSQQGDCPDGVACEVGWFGPACQYADLAYTAWTSHPTATDGDDSSCLTPPGLDNVEITLNQSIHFTWLRIRLNNPDFLFTLTVSFRQDAMLSCTNTRTAQVDITTLDIHCDLNKTVEYVVLSGKGIQHLCSVYISGGRNVALKQNATQSSVYTQLIQNNNVAFDATKAVDGNRTAEFIERNTCTHTDPDRPDPNLNVTFSRLQYITRYVLYNRNNNAERLQHFELRSFNNVSGPPVLDYKDNSSRGEPVYTVTPESVATPIRLVNIRADNLEKILTICELEVYGDSACETGMYGRDCEHTCHCAGGQSCFVSTGGCPSGCAAGLMGQDCSTRCNQGRYGPGCQLSCSQFCVRGNDTGAHFCDNTDGACLHGCLSGYQGSTCSQEEPHINDAAVIAAVVCVVVVLMLVVLIILFFRRRRRPAREDVRALGGHEVKHSTDELPSTSKAGPGAKHGFKLLTQKQAKEASNDSSNGIYYNTLAHKTSTVVALGELLEFMKSKDRAFFQSQFAAIPGNQAATMTVGQSPENKDKNRYKNICAYDHSRVQLQPNEDKNQGYYINASYVEGYRNDEKFIASQGPTKTILEDFLRMLWEQEVDKVVMLTNLVEDGKQKCERYWPEEGHMKVGEMTVRLTTTQVFADYTIRRLQLKKESEPLRNLIQFHFTAWPDKDIPTVPWGLVDFEQRVASYPTNKPIVVHCSAGVGRTGTFIALRNVMREAEETGHMDFFTAVGKLRQDRINMVQTVDIAVNTSMFSAAVDVLDQYIFLHRSALVAMSCIGTTVTLADVESRMKTLEAKSKSGMTKLQQEFQTICTVCGEQMEEMTSEDSQHSVYENSRNIDNRNKNRVPSILPKEMYRAVLSCGDSDTSDYINAVLVPSFVKQNQEILTQLPFPSTVTDFWRLVTQYKVSLMVAFETDKKTKDKTIGDYLPSDEGEPRIFGEFTLRTEPDNSKALWKQEKVYISQDTNGKTDKPRPLTHLTCTDNLDPASVLAVTQHVRSQKSATDGRILYMCRNGAEYSGLVYVLSLLLDRLDNDHHLTVPLVVGAVKAIRPQVIATLDQYRLLYKVLQLYSHSVNEYSNFAR